MRHAAGWSGILAALLAAGCSAPLVRMDRDLDRYSSAALKTYELGDPRKAAEYYRQALARARATDLRDEVARGSFNLAVCLAEIGQLDEARWRMRDARQDFAGSAENSIRSYLLEGRWAEEQGDPVEAQALALGALQAGADRYPDLAAQSHLLLAQIATTGGDLERGHQEVAAGRKAARKHRNPGVMGQVERELARIATQENRPAEAAAHQDARADWLRRAGEFRGMAAALQAAGDAYVQCAADREAVDRYFRAARSYWGQHDAAAARTALARASLAARTLDDKDWRERIVALQEEIEPGSGALPGAVESGAEVR